MCTDKFTDIKSLWTYIKKQGCQKYPTIANDKIGNVWKWECYYQKCLISYQRRLAACRRQWLHCDWLWHINATRTSTHPEVDPSFSQQIIDGISVWPEGNCLTLVWPNNPEGPSWDKSGGRGKCLANLFHIFSGKLAQRDGSLACQTCLKSAEFTQMTHRHPITLSQAIMFLNVQMLRGL